MCLWKLGIKISDIGRTELLVILECHNCMSKNKREGTGGTEYNWVTLLWNENENWKFVDCERIIQAHPY